MGFATVQEPNSGGVSGRSYKRRSTCTNVTLQSSKEIVVAEVHCKTPVKDKDGKRITPSPETKENTTEVVYNSQKEKGNFC
ncbi:hypothetical protein GBAR_LOCUS9918 [Geodia barretti]|uniref:Uncharacterized protein n=1 Tax=Geodia barretti TaxID=519541 RepID=A0AA35RTK3_GEOBA|nr:hypothetical protein GBAR_LOCUS9918 [Geodia barretti]